MYFFFLPDFSTWIFGHQFKLQIAKIKWTNSHHLCKPTPTRFSSSWFCCLSKDHHHPVAQVKTWKSFLLLLFLQHPISHQVMWILLSIFHFKLCKSAFYYQYINPRPPSSLSCWLFRNLPLLLLLRVIIPSCPQFQLYSLLLPEKAFTNARRKVDSFLPLLKSDWWYPISYEKIIIYLWLCWCFTVVQGFLCREWGLLSSFGVPASHWSGSSHCRARALGVRTQ